MFLKNMAKYRLLTNNTGQMGNQSTNTKKVEKSRRQAFNIEKPKTLCKFSDLFLQSSMKPNVVFSTHILVT
jgi:hypothetical protein